MTLMQSLIVYFFGPVIGVMIFLIFAQVIFSWLVSFGVVNLRNPAVSQIHHLINRFVNPILEPIRKIVPSFGGLDFSPIIALLALSWIKNFVLFQKLYPMLG